MPPQNPVQEGQQNWWHILLHRKVSSRDSDKQLQQNSKTTTFYKPAKTRNINVWQNPAIGTTNKDGYAD